MRNYPAKLLLFGEHVLLLGASALAVPVPAFTGKWARAENTKTPDRRRESLIQFAESEVLKSISGIDIEALRNDISDGWHFPSSIPEGYGLGSSGALCAGIYNRYVLEKTQDLPTLKGIFARMESYFHGSSSGIDPLTSYLAQPLLIRQKTQVSVAEAAIWQEAPVVFLLDTQIPRQTGPLVEWFLDQSAQMPFAQALNSTFLPAHEAMIQSWLRADDAEFWIHLHTVSQFQYDYFDPMIPAAIRPVWEKSLQTPGLRLKICGAGGGGFVLGFARTEKIVKEILAEYPIVFPFENPV